MHPHNNKYIIIGRDRVINSHNNNNPKDNINTPKDDNNHICRYSHNDTPSNNNNICHYSHNNNIPKDNNNI